MSRRKQSGFTLVELMVVVAIIGLLSSIAIPSFIRYTKKAKTAEARELVRKMYDGARSYYMDPNVRPQSIGGATVAPMFPEPSQPATPASGTCCANGGKCNPATAYWQNPTWTAMAFSADDPHYYHYAYTVVGNAVLGGAAPTDGTNTYTTLAYGDLDCDGNFSTFSAFGVVDVQYSTDGPTGSSMVVSVSEIE